MYLNAEAGFFIFFSLSARWALLYHEEDGSVEKNKEENALKCYFLIPFLSPGTAL
jgi:hypothetical protein